MFEFVSWKRVDSFNFYFIWWRFRRSFGCLEDMRSVWWSKLDASCSRILSLKHLRYLFDSHRDWLRDNPWRKPYSWVHRVPCKDGSFMCFRFCGILAGVCTRLTRASDSIFDCGIVHSDRNFDFGLGRSSPTEEASVSNTEGLGFESLVRHNGIAGGNGCWIVPSFWYLPL